MFKHTALEQFFFKDEVLEDAMPRKRFKLDKATYLELILDKPFFFLEFQQLFYSIDYAYQSQSIVTTSHLC